MANCDTSLVDGSYVVDVRSDTLTQPTDAMRQAMFTATTGDDVFGEDPTVHELQRKCAATFGMESALFVPSGTMGNLISVLCHCDRRGQEALFGHQSHMIIFEQGGVAQIGGVMPRTMPNLPDGTFDLDQLDDYIRQDDPHYPQTALIVVENTHGNCGGKVLPLDFLSKLRSRTNELGLPVHMDGARVMNAAVALGVELREILEYVDSVSICLSKGVGAPIGSVIGGSTEFIQKAMRLRKVLGGGWRQPGPLAAAGLVALQDCRERITIDHHHAKLFARGLQAKVQEVVHVDVQEVHSNVALVKILKAGLTAEQFCARLNKATDEESMVCGERIRVKALCVYKDVVRIIFCHNNSTTDVEKTLKKFDYVLKELSV